jgi:hypothetical protein
MSIGADKIQFTPSQGSILKDVSAPPFSSLTDIVLPKLNEVTVYGGLTRNQGLVYNASKFGFSYLENSNLHNNGEERTFAKINVVVPENSVPSISGIKVIGYATTTATGTGQQAYPNPVNSGAYQNTNMTIRRTFMFKIWRQFRWTFSSPTPPHKPELNTSIGEYEIYASTGEGSPFIINNQFSPSNNIFAGESHLYNSFAISKDVGATISQNNVGVDWQQGIGTNPVEFTFDDNLDPNDSTKAIYSIPLKATINTDDFTSNYALTMIKGLITTY